MGNCYRPRFTVPGLISRLLPQAESISMDKICKWLGYLEVHGECAEPFVLDDMSDSRAVPERSDMENLRPAGSELNPTHSNLAVDMFNLNTDMRPADSELNPTHSNLAVDMFNLNTDMRPADSELNPIHSNLAVDMFNLNTDMENLRPADSDLNPTHIDWTMDMFNLDLELAGPRLPLDLYIQPNMVAPIEYRSNSVQPSTRAFGFDRHGQRQVSQYA